MQGNLVKRALEFLAKNRRLEFSPAKTGETPEIFGGARRAKNCQRANKIPSIPLTERLRKLSPPLSTPKDEGIVSGASNPPGFARALADLERGSHPSDSENYPFILH